MCGGLIKQIWICVAFGRTNRCLQLEASDFLHQAVAEKFQPGTSSFSTHLQETTSSCARVSITHRLNCSTRMGYLGRTLL
jgi:hypothetical protein